MGSNSGTPCIKFVVFIIRKKEKEAELASKAEVEHQKNVRAVQAFMAVSVSFNILVISIFN